MLHHFKNISACLSGVRFVRTGPPIGKVHAPDGRRHNAVALFVVNAETYATVVADVDLRQIPMQMLLTAVLVDASEAALEDRKVALDRVGVSIAAHVFRDGMID